MLQTEGSSEATTTWVWVTALCLTSEYGCFVLLWAEPAAARLLWVRTDKQGKAWRCDRGGGMRCMDPFSFFCAKSFSGPQSPADKHGGNAVGDGWELLMGKESLIDEEAWITGKLEWWCSHCQLNGESKWTIERRKWKSILGGELNRSVVMKKQSVSVVGETKKSERERERERGICQLSANTVILHLNTHCVTWLTTSERGRSEGGRRHCTESTSTTMDGRTPITHTRTHTHTHYCTGSQSAFHCTLLAARTSLCLVKKKQQTNRSTK